MERPRLKRVYDRPGGRSVLTLGPRTDLSGPRVLLVAGSTAGWVRVRLPVRPNTATGWVRRDQVTASPSSLLDTDATNGLQLTIQSCPTAWTEAGTSPAYTYTCTGTATTVLPSRPVSIPTGSPVTLSP